MKIFLINLNDIFLKNKSLNIFKTKFNSYLKNIQFSLKKFYKYITLKSRFLSKYKNKFLLIKNIININDKGVILKKIFFKEIRLARLEKYLINFKVQVQINFNRLRKFILNRFFFNIRNLINKISIIKNIDLILNIQGKSVIYLNKYFDITNIIIYILNKY